MVVMMVVVVVVVVVVAASAAPFYQQEWRRLPRRGHAVATLFCVRNAAVG
jgi:Tfp pilus assembly protein PilE